ncbi:MAG: exodeoxyribonuclease VII small subunit [Parachlamydiales bacterium]
MTKEIPFEKAFARLEEILERMNSGEVPLDEALKLYEEADKLIGLCSERLTCAEQKIEKLVKNREGGVSVGEDGNPLTEPLE